MRGRSGEERKEEVTVGELIDELRKFDPAMRVMTPGFDESGVEPIGVPYIRRIGTYIRYVFPTKQTFTDFYVPDIGIEYTEEYDAVIIDYEE